MKTSLPIVLVLMIRVSMGYATRSLSSRELPRDSGGDTSFRPSEAEGQLASVSPRDGRKMIFINNTAYDLNEEEMAVYLNEGRVSTSTDKLKRRPSMDALLPALLKKSETKERPREKSDDDALLQKRTQQEESVKASRFVADPEKAHLIQKVDEEEVQNLKKLATTTPKPDERVVTEASPAVETSTVRYEITQVSVLQFLWNEFKNIGDLLGREMIGTLSGTLSYLWETVVRYVTNRSRRGIQDASDEL